MTRDLTQQVERAAQRLGQLKARQALREMRVTQRAKARARREDFRRRLALGSAVIEAGCGEWEIEAIADVLKKNRHTAEAHCENP